MKVSFHQNTTITWLQLNNILKVTININNKFSINNSDLFLAIATATFDTYIKIIISFQNYC